MDVPQLMGKHTDVQTVIVSIFFSKVAQLIHNVQLKHLLNVQMAFVFLKLGIALKLLMLKV